MTFDLLSTVGITAGVTAVVAIFVALFGSSLAQRISIGAAMTLWFIGVRMLRTSAAGDRKVLTTTSAALRG